VLTALEAELAGPSPADGAATVLNDALALADLAAGGPDGPVFDVNLRAVPDDLQKFLLQRQIGARGVARTVFAAVAKARARSFSAASGTLAGQRPRAVFQDLPEDYGHFAEPYYIHLLRGLKREPPAYVLDVLAGEQPSSDAVPPAAGVVVIRL